MTPSKARHASEEDAIAAGLEHEALNARVYGRPSSALYVYHCPCLAWHLTHHMYGRDGRRNRRVMSE